MPNTQDIQNYISGRIAAQGGAGNFNNWSPVLQDVSNYAKMNNLDPNMVAQAASNINPNFGWDANKVQQTMAQFSPQTNYGLQPAMNTLNQGAADATQRIGQTQQQVGDLY